MPATPATLGGGDLGGAVAEDPSRDFPRLAEGLEFGPEESAGGTVVAFLPPDRFLEVSCQTARLLRLVNGERDIRSLAELASAELSMLVSPRDLRELFEQRLLPQGFIRYGPDASSGVQPSGHRYVRLLSPAGVVAVARVFVPLFRPPVAVIAAAVGLGAQVWFFVAAPRSTAAPGAAGVVDWGVAIGLWLLSMVVHEVGHASALLGFGGVPGEIGLNRRRGILSWSADVTGMWKLPRHQRAAVDLGGVYLQAAFAGVLILVHASLPGALPAVVVARVVVILDTVILFSLLPRWRSDGYWLSADLAGERRSRGEAAGHADPESDIKAGRRNGMRAYALAYATLGSAGYTGLWMWLALHPGVAGSLAWSRPVDAPALVALAMGLAVKGVVLLGLALSIWTGLAAISAGGTGRPGLGSRIREGS